LNSTCQDIPEFRLPGPRLKRRHAKIEASGLTLGRGGGIVVDPRSRRDTRL